MGKCYQISAARNCFHELLPLLANCSATYAAVQVHTARLFSSPPDHAFVITCKHLDARVALPLHGPIEDALKTGNLKALELGFWTAAVQFPLSDLNRLGSRIFSIA